MIRAADGGGDNGDDGDGGHNHHKNDNRVLKDDHINDNNDDCVDE